MYNVFLHSKLNFWIQEMFIESFWLQNGWKIVRSAEGLTPYEHHKLCLCGSFMTKFKIIFIFIYNNFACNQFRVFFVWNIWIFFAIWNDFLLFWCVYVCGVCVSLDKYISKCAINSFGHVACPILCMQSNTVMLMTHSKIDTQMLYSTQCINNFEWIFDLVTSEQNHSVRHKIYSFHDL